ncbi:serine hydrolase [Mycolicibacterium fortuitum]|uniref:serine hydrolase n=1 Tax=Mycolicibacterium fortuitum TaxID=1766 RepID=UPI0026028D0D|nr:serine hydrolase [Mycolicibacterium fortuitum]
MPSPDGAARDTTLWNPSWADAAGKIISTIADLRTWLTALSRGAMLHPDTHARRLASGTPIAVDAKYAFAICSAQGWIGHNGDIAGYTTVAAYLPDRKATLAIVLNSPAAKANTAGQLVTPSSIVTPEHTYAL